MQRHRCFLSLFGWQSTLFTGCDRCLPSRRDLHVSCCSPVSRETVQQLKEALAGESAAVASSHLLDITRSVARNAEAEVAAAESLHHFIGSRNGSSNGRSAIAELEAAIYRAANFPRLQVIVPLM